MSRQKTKVTITLTLMCMLAMQVLALELPNTHNPNTPDAVRAGRYFQPQSNRHEFSKTDGRLHTSYSQTEEFRNSTIKEQLQKLQKTNATIETSNIFAELNIADVNQVNLSNDGYLLAEEISEMWFDAEPDRDKRQFFYDDNGNDTLMELQNEQSGSWINIFHETKSYDTSNNVDSKLGKRWTGNAWENLQQVEYVYNSDNHVLEEHTYYWDGSDWTPSTRTYYSYDEDEKILDEFSQYHDGSTWIDNYQVDSSYDSLGYLYDVVMLAENGSGLAPFWNGQYEHNAVGEMVNEINRYWENSAWLNSDRIVYSYDENGNNSEIMTSNWENGSWIEDYNAILSYNEFNNQTGALGYTHLTGHLWANTVRITFEYDEFQNNTNYLFEQNWDQNGWHNFSQETRSFIPLNPTALDPEPVVHPDEVQLIGNFPNPFNPSTSIEFSLSAPAIVELSIIDLEGREVTRLVSGPQGSGLHQVHFDASNLASGVYIYRLSAENTVLSGRLTLLK